MPPQQTIDLSAGLRPAQERKTTPASGPIDLSAGLRPVLKEPPPVTKEQVAPQPAKDIPGPRPYSEVLQNLLLQGLISTDTMQKVVEKTSYALGGKTLDELEKERDAAFARGDYTTGRWADFWLRNEKGLSSELSSLTSPASLGALGAGRFLRGAAGLAFAVPFVAHGVQAMTQPRQEGETEADVLERRLKGAAQVSMAVPGLKAAIPQAAAQIRAMPSPRLLMQRYWDVGPELTQEALVMRQAAGREAEAAHKQQTFETLLKRGDILKKTEAAYQKELAAARKQHAEEAQAIREKNEARWQEQTVMFEKQLAAAKSQEERIRLAQERRQSIAEENDRLAMELRDTARTAEKNFREVMRQRYDAIRAAIGENEADGETIANAVRFAEQNILAGSPENIRIFRNIMRATGEAELADASVFQGAGQAARRQLTGGPTRLEDFRVGDVPAANRAMNKEFFDFLAGISRSAPRLQFRDLQGFYSELGTKMFGGQQQIPGDIYHALKNVRNAIGSEMQRLADNSGVGNEMRSAQNDWRKFEATFHNMRSYERGGSPVARVVRAEDAAYAAKPVTSDARARAILQLKEFAPFGARPDLAETIQRNAIEFAKLRKQAEAAAPKQPEPPVRKDKPVPDFVEPERTAAKLPDMPLAPGEQPAVNPQALKREHLAKRGRGMESSAGHRPYADIAAVIAAAKGLPMALAYPVGRRVMGKSLQHGRAQEWLSKPTAAEIEFAARGVPAETAAEFSRLGLRLPRGLTESQARRLSDISNIIIRGPRYRDMDDEEKRQELMRNIRGLWQQK